MQHLKKMIFGLAALVIAFGLIFTASAFKNKKHTSDLAYQYDGDDDSGVMSPGSWTPVPYVENPTACEAEGELVCIVQFNETEFSDIADFLGNYANAAQVNASSYAVRHKEPVE